MYYLPAKSEESIGNQAQMDGQERQGSSMRHEDYENSNVRTQAKKLTPKRPGKKARVENFPEH